METVSMDKKYRTRGNYACRLYAVDGHGDTPVHGSINMGDGWQPVSWRIDGSHSPVESWLDLIEVKEPERFGRWVNMYKDIGSKSYQHKTKQEALDMAASDCIGTICIELLIHDDGRKEARIIEVV